MRKYLLDSNVFIQAKNQYYGFEFCPAFWEWLIRNRQIVVSLDKVKEELVDGGDSLSEWVKGEGKVLFQDFDEKALSFFEGINEYLRRYGYEPSAITSFQQDADYYLVAYAKAHNFSIVTLEVPGGSKNKVKIPDVCVGTKVDCINTYKMLRAEKARFILEKNH